MLSLPSSPLSSPSSSPSLGAVDSSPPSSPTLEPLTSSPISPGPAHPYAASTKVVKPLPLYEKRGTKRPRYRERWADQIDSDVEIADVFIDETPPRRVSRATDAWNTDISSHARPLVDPLAASAKQEWIPPMREKKLKTHSRATSDASTVTDVFSASTISGGLQDAFVYRPPPVLKAPNHQSDLFSTDSLLQTSPAASRSRRTNMNTEHRRWDDAINSAIAEANGVVDLSASGVLGTVLTHIPSSIKDLASLVLLGSEDDLPAHQTTSGQSQTSELEPGCPPRKRLFVRSSTVPTCQPGQSIFEYSPPAKTSAKVRSSNHVPSGDMPIHVPKVTEIQLLLERNTISQLPIELFSIVSLTVLNLRGNTLKSIPPQIAQLVNLRELYIGNNKLTYLPAELLGMKLQTLELNINPWMKPEEISAARLSRFATSTISSCGASDRPGPSSQYARQPIQLTCKQGSEERVIAETTVHSAVAPLAEYCLRVLLAPNRVESPPPATFTQPSPRSHSPILPHAVELQSPPWPHYEMNLQAYHRMPLSRNDGYPSQILDMLHACHPDSVARPDTRLHVPHHTSFSGKRAKQTRPTSLHDEIFSFAPTLDPALHTPPSSDIALTCHALESEAEEDGEARTVNDPAVSVCPSPAHFPLNSRVYVHHAEERFSWEDVIAGIPVDTKGGVPVLWRGCSQGCLRFLDPPDVLDAVDNENPGPEQTGIAEDMECMEIDIDTMEEQSENGFGVEAMDLSGGLDDFD